MTSHGLETIAPTLVAEGKGILAADETIPTLTRRFDTLGYTDGMEAASQSADDPPHRRDWRDD